MSNMENYLYIQQQIEKNLRDMSRLQRDLYQLLDQLTSINNEIKSKISREKN